MFTGLVAERGRILSHQPSPNGGVRLEIGASPELLARLSLGASLAVSGVCLTVIELTADRVALELGQETLDRSTLGQLEVGAEVNLETALRMGDPLGGHWVQGHVDGLVELLARDERDGHAVLTFSLPAAFQPWVVEKGSVTLDGVSLTVAALHADHFEVWLIPHTLAVTTFGRRQPGDRFHFEGDILAKQVERVLALHGFAAGAARQP